MLYLGDCFDWTLPYVPACHRQFVNPSWPSPCPFVAIGHQDRVRRANELGTERGTELRGGFRARTKLFGSHWKRSCRRLRLTFPGLSLTRCSAP